MRAARWSVAQGMLRTGALATDAALAAEVGFDEIGLELPSVLAEGAVEVRRILDDHGLTASSLIQLPMLLDPAGESDDRFRAALDSAAVIGSPVVLIGTGRLGPRPAAEADPHVAERLAALGDLAATVGVRVLLEPGHPLMRGWCYVHTIDHAVRLIGDHDHLGLAVDVAHLWWDPDLPFAFAEHVERVDLVQVADVPTGALDDLRYERCALGTGDVPVADLLGAFHAAGYRGTYECEILMRMPSDLRPTLLRESLAWLNGVGGTW